MKGRTQWSEVHQGGSAQAERAMFESLGQQMLEVQERHRVAAGAPSVARTLHAKIVCGIADARLLIDESIPGEFAVGHFRAGAMLPAQVRFSNASGIPQADDRPDMRGIAIKLGLPDGTCHDLLMTSYPVSHARDARQFVDFAMIASAGRENLMARLVERFGEAEARRMLDNIGQGMRPCASLAAQRFWSRGAVLWGTDPVRFELRPHESAPPPFGDELPTGVDGLRREFEARLAQADVRYRFALQPFVDEQLTPIEDASVEWREATSTPVEIATLVIAARDLTGPAGTAALAQIDAQSFNPWNAPAEFRPLGNLNRARAVVYGMSAQRWLPAGAGTDVALTGP